MNHPPSTSKRLSKLEIPALIPVIVALVMGAISAIHAGGFWRDEANTLVIALAPWKQSWELSRFDAMPQILFLLCKTWHALTPFMSQEASFRLFGFLVWCGIIGSVWFAGRSVWGTTPTFAISLLCMAPYFVRYTETMRPYGLAAIGATWAFIVFWHASQKGGRKLIWLVCLVTLINIHTHLLNCIVVLGIATIAAALTWFRKERRLAVSLLAAAALPLPTLAIYRDMLIQMTKVSDVAGRTQPISPFISISELYGSYNVWVLWAWVATLVVAALLITWTLLKKRDKVQLDAYALCVALFCTLGICAFGYLISSPWYYIPATCVATLCLATSLETRINDLPKGWLWRGAYVVPVLLLCAPATVRALQYRQTNIDLIAKYLEKQAAPGDVIMVSPWYYAMTFHYYYKGQAPFSSIPPMQDTSIHRQDQLMAQIAAQAPMEPLLKDVKKALDSGHRVWLVGSLTPATNWQTVRWSPPQGKTWAIRRAIATQIWSSQVVQTLSEANKPFVVVDIPQHALHYENVQLTVANP